MAQRNEHFRVVYKVIPPVGSPYHNPQNVLPIIAGFERRGYAANFTMSLDGRWPIKIGDGYEITIHDSRAAMFISATLRNTHGFALEQK